MPGWSSRSPRCGWPSSELDSAPDALAERVARLEQAMVSRGALGGHRSIRRRARRSGCLTGKPRCPRRIQGAPADPRAKPAIGALRRQRAEETARADEPPPEPAPSNTAGRARAGPACRRAGAGPRHARRGVGRPAPSGPAGRGPRRSTAPAASWRWRARPPSSHCRTRATCAAARRSAPWSKRRSSAHFGTSLGLRLVVDEPDSVATPSAGAGRASDPADLGDDDYDPDDPGEPLEVESLVQSRILEAFPGAEEVQG